MYINKQHTTVCILLTTFILLLGICFDCGQADSFLLCYSTKHYNDLNCHFSSIFDSKDSVSIFNEICSGQVCGRQSYTNIHQLTSQRNFWVKAGKGNSSTSFVMYILPMLLSSILISVSYNFMPDVRKASIVIRYIQHKDGKKTPFFSNII